MKQDWIEEPVRQGRQEGSKQLRLPSRSTTSSPCFLVTYIFHTLCEEWLLSLLCVSMVASDRPGLERSPLNAGFGLHQSLYRVPPTHTHTASSIATGLLKWRATEESGLGITRVHSLATTRLIPRAATEDSSQGFCRNDKGKGGADRRKQREEGGAEAGPPAASGTSNPAPASHFLKVAPGRFLLQLASCQRFH